uniref:Benzylsuccinate synthase alpha chain n=1 Tax=Siphoviridae sp. cthrG7 TaxID=2826428 RepID=A0A8S5MCB6_9CAUD|nr:MAG TPA: benzylsuccinate synthase alpha chain [Siphoviridae sp. cthrG7]
MRIIFTSQILSSYLQSQTSTKCYSCRWARLMLTKFEGFFYALTNRFPSFREMIYTK